MGVLSVGGELLSQRRENGKTTHEMIE